MVTRKPTEAIAAIVLIVLVTLKRGELRDELKSRADTIKAGPRATVAKVALSTGVRTVELSGEDCL
jgi:hypothetical protein